MASDFLTTYAPLANDIATQTGLDPSVVLGIIDTETGAGVHVKGNNIFGISPGGKVASYPSVEAAAQSFVNLMQTPRYAGVAAAGDPAGQATALVKSGYNTVNPNYARLVGSKALSFGKQLGYQESPTASPAAAPAAATPVPASQQPPDTGSAKDRVLGDPALGGGDTTTAPTQPAAATPPPAATAKERLLADPALQPTQTAEKEAPSTAAKPWEYSPPEAGDPDMTPRPSAFPATVAQARNALQPEPGYARLPGIASILPLSFKETTPGSGQIDTSNPSLSDVKVDWGSTVNALGGNALLDLLEGTGQATSMGGDAAPLAGKVSPEATALLLAGRLGNPNPLQARTTLMENPRAGIQFGGSERWTPPPGFDAAKAPLPADFKANPLTATGKTAAETATAATPDAATATPTGIPAPSPDTGGAPRSVGAMGTPTYESIHTPAEEAAYRANAEGQKLLEGQKIGEPDRNQYIPGETVNSAEQEQSVKIARELKSLGIRVPEASQIAKEAEENNNTARRVYLDNTAKGSVEIANREAQRETAINADKKTVFAPENVKGKFDKQPIIEHMEAVLSDPENIHNGALQSLYRQQLERVKAADFNNPVEAWSLRRDFDRLTSKRMQSDDPNLHSIGHFLNTASDVIDSQIEKVAPGYADMLARYKEHSRAIDEMTVLQSATKNLRGPGMKLTFNDFQRFMKNVVDSRMTPSTDLNPFKAISDENMTRLWNIRDSLRRSASAKELAAAAGSDTAPNIIDALKAVGKMGGVAGAHAMAGAIFGPGANLTLQALATVGKHLNDQRLINRATRRMNLLMNPREPLRVPPGQENVLTGGPQP